ncbi:MAG TPA: TlpA disulfide reductase family protein [Gammaproteobacteria bacterium]|nr:TlpA disulfide reductase family protein [Gammaproteobacteria bacterium]
MKRVAQLALVVALGAVAAGAGYWLQHRGAASRPAGAVSSVLDASVADLNGTPRRLDEWRGKLVVLNFWATWCPPCLKEMPAFVRLQRRYGERGLQFVGIALDTREDVAKFVQEHGIDFPILAGEDDVARYMLRLGNTIGALPFTVVVDRDGAVRHTHQGEWPEAEAERIISGLLDRPAS